MRQKRGRPPIISQKFYTYDYAAAAKKESNPSVRVKLLALEQIKDGKGYREVAKVFKFHETAVKDWVQRVVKDGLNGLRLKEGRGRKPKLANNNIVKSKAAIKELQEKRPGGRINVSEWFG